MTSPEYQAPTWVNDDDPGFVEGVSPDLGAGYLNELSGAVEDHGQRLGAITPVVTYLNANAVTQDAGDNRYILQDNAVGFAPAEATANALAGKQPLDADLTAIAGLDSATAGTVASDGAGWVKKTYAQFKTALGLVKGDVGLGNVDNTSDSAKPVSTATQTALDAKVGTADSRLTDTRTPTDNSVTDAKVTTGAAISADKLADGTTNKVLTAAERTKLAGVATSATANSTDAQLRDRATHTGAQAISTVTGLQGALDAKTALTVDGVPVSTYDIDTTPVTAADVGAQPADTDLTAIAGLAHADDTILQTKAGAWTARTIAQVKADLAVPDAETIQDTAATLLTSGTHSGISFAYDDTAGTVAATVSGGGATPHWEVGPATSGFAGWTGDPTQGMLANSIQTGGTPILSLIRVETAGVLNNLLAYVGTAGATPTAGQCFAAIYDASGSRLGVSADIGSQITSIGVKTFAMTSPTSSVAAGALVYGLLLTNAGTNPAWGRASMPTAALTVGLMSRRFGNLPPGATTAPTSFTPSSLTAASAAFWMAVT